jgi:hypothetical protein
MEQEQRRERPDGGARDPAQDNAAMLDNVSQNFNLAMEMVKQDCEERGVDFDAIQKQAKEDVEKNREANRKRRKKRRVNPLVKAAEKYWKGADKWFKTHRNTIAARNDELISLLKMALPGQKIKQIEATAKDLRDALDVIRWYQYFVSAKLYRAVGQDGDEDDDLYPDEDPAHVADQEERQAQIDARESDANGSAKIALIALDKSIDAWSRVRDHVPRAGDEIIDILVQLDRLRKDAENAFPRARAFVRPGFDDGTPLPGDAAVKARRKKERGKRS